MLKISGFLPLTCIHTLSNVSVSQLDIQNIGRENKIGNYIKVAIKLCKMEWHLKTVTTGTLTLYKNKKKIKIS